MAPHLPIALLASPARESVSDSRAGLVLRDVVKSWRSGDPAAPEVRPALRGVSLEVQRGERVVLVSVPRAGATTLLLVAAGLAAPDAGEVHRASSLRSGGVRFVPTHPALPGSWTPRDVLTAAAPAPWPVAMRRAAIGRALAAAGLSPVADVPLRNLTPRAAWQTALAAARLAAPLLLLVDRPPDAAASVAAVAELDRQVAAVAEAPEAAAVVLVLPPGSPLPRRARVAHLVNGRLHDMARVAGTFVESASGAS